MNKEDEGSGFRTRQTLSHNPTLFRSCVGDEPYSRLNDVVCVICGEARPLPEGAGFSIVLDVQELVLEPPGD